MLIGLIVGSGLPKLIGNLYICLISSDLSPLFGQIGLIKAFFQMYYLTINHQIETLLLTKSGKNRTPKLQLFLP